jgi:hypothetical protein
VWLRQYFFYHAASGRAGFPPHVGHLTAAIHPPFRIEVAFWTHCRVQLSSKEISLFGYAVWKYDISIGKRWPIRMVSARVTVFAGLGR